MRTRRLLAVALAVLALAPVGCSDGGPGEGEARLEVDGTAIVERLDGDQDEVTGSTDLRAGERVEVTEGVGRMVLRGGTRMELRAGLDDAANSVLLMGTTPELEAGELLVSTPGTVQIVSAGTALAVNEGSARLTRSLGVGVAAYDADVQVDSAGQEREVRGLRQMQVPVLGRPPRVARPLSYRGGDPWDRRFLGQAMELGERLESLAAGYTQNLGPGQGRTPGFFRLVLPGLDDEPEFTAELIDVDQAPGETLVGAAITQLGKRGGFVERWRDVFGFRTQGAAWGLVALDQEVSGTPLLGTIEQAIGSSPLAFVEPGAPVGGGLAPGAPSGGSGGSGGPSSPPPTSPPPTSPPPTSPPPTTPPPPENPLGPLLDPLLDPVEDLLSEVVGGLLGAL